ncbi:hypothetical protein AGLY_014722 [Aphis glycines]|uniref:Uncharacterized protein n=1 Tax=Aphis glycines TaxID=307491 RepID=A0A6G0T2E1_APHGL|nr:hypothetical protein AGLY_014722 [Aphis glycines]
MCGNITSMSNATDLQTNLNYFFPFLLNICLLLFHDTILPIDNSILEPLFMIGSEFADRHIPIKYRIFGLNIIQYVTESYDDITNITFNKPINKYSFYGRPPLYTSTYLRIETKEEASPTYICRGDLPANICFYLNSSDLIKRYLEEKSVVIFHFERLNVEFPCTIHGRRYYCISISNVLVILTSLNQGPGTSAHQLCFPNNFKRIDKTIHTNLIATT